MRRKTTTCMLNTTGTPWWATSSIRRSPQTSLDRNELRFEDLKGSEQLYMNAEKDYDLHVEHDWHTMVGNEQHTTITANQFRSERTPVRRPERERTALHECGERLRPAC